MADIGTIRAAINADTKNWTGGFAGATRTLKGFSTAVPALLKPVGIAVAAMGAAAVTAASLVAVKTTQMYARFQQDMANVSTMIRANSTEITEELSASVLKLSRDIPQATTQLTTALYDILSASVPVAESMDVLAASGRAAVAGVSDVQTAANLATGTINALGMSFKDVDKVFDVAFSTILTGKLTLEQLAGSLGQVLPSAKKMNASMEEVYGSIAFLTKNAFSADMASVSLARALDGLGLKADELEGMGVKIFGEEGDYVGIVRVMEQIAVQIDGLTEKAQVDIFKKMGFDVRAARAIVTMATNLDAFKTTMDEVSDSAGKGNIAYDKLSKTITSQWGILKNSFNELWINVGKGFSGIASEGIAKITGLVQGITDLITGGGGLVNLWINHRDIAVKLLEGMATSGLQFVGQFAIGVGEILMAVALPAWEEFDRAVRKTREGTIHWLISQYETYLDWSGDANTRIESEEQRHIQALIDIDAGHTVAQKEAIDKSVERLKSAGKISAAAAKQLFDEFRSQLETANTELQAKVSKGTTDAAEQQVSTIDKVWSWLENNLQAAKTRMDAETDTGMVHVEGLDKRMAAVREANAKADQEFLKQARAAAAEIEADAARLPGELAKALDKLYVEMAETRARWSDRRAALEDRDQKRTEDAQQKQRDDNAKTLKDSIEGLAKYGVAVEEVDKKTLDRRARMLKRFQTKEIAAYDTQKELIDAKYNEMLVAYQTFGKNTLELERWRTDQVFALRVGIVDNYIGGLDTQFEAFSSFAEGHAALYGSWIGDLFGMSDDFHKTTLSQFGTWAEEQIELLNGINDMWKSLIDTWETAKGVIRTLTDLYGKIFGSEGGGGALGTAGNLAGLAGGGGGGGDGGAIGTAAGGAGLFGKIGAGIKSGAGAIGSGASSAASGIGVAAAAVAPWILPAAGVAIAYKALGPMIETLTGWDLPWTGTSTKKTPRWKEKGFESEEAYHIDFREREAARWAKDSAAHAADVASRVKRFKAEVEGREEARDAVVRYANDLGALHALRLAGNQYAQKQITWLLKTTDAYDGLSDSVRRTIDPTINWNRRARQASKRMVEASKSANGLSDELAGHSLTTAFADTAKEADKAGASYKRTEGALNSITSASKLTSAELKAIRLQEAVAASASGSNSEQGLQNLIRQGNEYALKQIQQLRKMDSTAVTAAQMAAKRDLDIAQKQLNLEQDRTNTAIKISQQQAAFDLKQIAQLEKMDANQVAAAQGVEKRVLDIEKKRLDINAKQLSMTKQQLDIQAMTHAIAAKQLAQNRESKLLSKEAFLRNEAYKFNDPISIAALARRGNVYAMERLGGLQEQAVEGETNALLHQLVDNTSGPRGDLDRNQLAQAVVDLILPSLRSGGYI